MNNRRIIVADAAIKRAILAKNGATTGGNVTIHTAIEDETEERIFLDIEEAPEESSTLAIKQENMGEFLFTLIMSQMSSF